MNPLLALSLAVMTLAIALAATLPPEPINKKATQEAKDLLKHLYSQNGKVTLTGQHDQMYHMGKPEEATGRIEKLTGQRPALWGCEWGFSDERHDVDNIKYRPFLIEEIKRHHKLGQIIVMTYHQASPTVGEPCDFVGGVQVKLTFEQWDDILTRGTRLHTVWEEHVDRLAEAFKTLQKEKIPVIFRPYHEMNGDWFWWGGNPERFKALWDMIYDRFTHHHKLNNLLWAWNPDKAEVGPVEKCAIDPDKFDLAGTDIYPRRGQPTFPVEWYNRMAKLAGGKPLALSENSEIPTPEQLKEMPFAYFMGWDTLTFINNDDKLRTVFSNPAYSSKPWRKPEK